MKWNSDSDLMVKPFEWECLSAARTCRIMTAVDACVRVLKSGIEGE